MIGASFGLHHLNTFSHKLVVKMLIWFGVKVSNDNSGRVSSTGWVLPKFLFHKEERESGISAFRSIQGTLGKYPVLQ